MRPIPSFTILNTTVLKGSLTCKISLAISPSTLVAISYRCCGLDQYCHLDPLNRTFYRDSSIISLQLLSLMYSRLPLSPCRAMLTIHGQFSNRFLIPSPQLSPTNAMPNKSATVIMSSLHYSVFCTSEFMPFLLLPPLKILSTYSFMLLLQ